MGFLDFLKKDKPASTASVQMPLPPGLPKDPSQIDWTQPPKFDDLPPLPSASASQSASQPEPMMFAPVRSNPVPPELDHDDGDFEKVPLPPVSMQDPDFLDSAADDLNPKKPEVIEKVVEKVVEVPQPAQQPALQAPAKIELPDFTDEELEAFQQTVPKPAQQPVPPVLPPPIWSAPKVEIVTEEPVVQAPANAIAIPPEDIKLPTGELLEIGKIEPAKFISSDSYFAIIADIKAIRKSLRSNDDVIKEATLRHEQLDLQFKRVASDINAVQEHFMKIDGALFEE